VSRRLRRAAFFDVDETLLAFSGFWSFLGHHLATRDSELRAAEEVDRTLRDLREVVSAGSSREEVCRTYYRIFAGQQVQQLAGQGEAWFATEQMRGGVFREAVLRAFQEHVALGDLTVLVSGSFAACLDPVSRTVGADVLLCSRPEVRDGCYTGKLDRPMIGEAKAEAVRRLAACARIDLDASAAYGDHESDLPFLRLVGRPVVVGKDPPSPLALAEERWFLGETRGRSPRSPRPGTRVIHKTRTHETRRRRQ
jgi:HAD superfamily hydrolase (TIGR01490 family)